MSSDASEQQAQRGLAYRPPGDRWAPASLQSANRHGGSTNQIQPQSLAKPSTTSVGPYQRYDYLSPIATPTPNLANSPEGEWNPDYHGTLTGSMEPTPVEGVAPFPEEIPRKQHASAPPAMTPEAPTGSGPTWMHPQAGYNPAVAGNSYLQTYYPPPAQTFTHAQHGSGPGYGYQPHPYNPYGYPAAPTATYPPPNPAVPAYAHHQVQHPPQPAVPLSIPAYTGPPAGAVPRRERDEFGAISERNMLTPSDRGRAKRQPPACLACRKLKIACRPAQVEGGGETRCEQCFRRSRPPSECVFPTESRRGLHSRKSERMESWKGTRRAE
ncbi:hypothetical protein MKEN_01326300 [Mycena kentingensis (nom. inval.)]|nr:hypothetical protein MKEN_01326300 [Mycena kentingensis (nom. inval.)]